MPAPLPAVLPPFAGAGPTFALLTAVCWAVGVVLFKRSGDAMGAVGLNVFKNLVGLVLFGVTLLITGASEPWGTGHDAWALIASGAVGIGIADTLFFRGLHLLGASRSAVVECLYSPFIVLFSFILLGERLGGATALGAGLILGGVLLATWYRRGGRQRTRPVLSPGPGAVRATDPNIDPRRLFIGAAYSTASMALMGIAIVAVKPILERHGVLWATTVRMVGGVAILVVLIGLHGPSRREAFAALRPQAAWRFAFPGALSGTYFALLCWIAGFKFDPATTASILNQTSTIFIVLLAAVFLGEPLTGRRGVAVLLAFAGSILVLVQ